MVQFVRHERPLRRFGAVFGVPFTLAAVALLGFGCASSENAREVRIIAHDSFVLSDESMDRLKAETGIELVVQTAGDAGVLVGNALLNRGEVGADILFGIDQILLPKALSGELFIPHQVDSSVLFDEFSNDTADGLVLPIDYGDVCINVDSSWYASKGLPAPENVEDFLDSKYRGHLVVPDPMTSSPGLAFLLSTVAKFGEEDFVTFWQRLRDNDVLVVGDWVQAYVGNFTAGGGSGNRPAVVSYATSPPAEIIYAEEPKPSAPNSKSLVDGCFRQVEYAGVLKGAKNVEDARRVMSWLVSQQVQSEVAENMFVLPTRKGASVPELFERFAANVTAPLRIESSVIESNLPAWLAQWAKAMSR